MSISPTASYRIISIAQLSLQWSDSQLQAEADIKKVVNTNPHIVGVTEASEFKKLLRECGSGYRLVQPLMPGTKTPASTALLVRNGIPMLDEGWLKTNNAAPGTPKEGGHRARGLTWVKINFLGNTIYLHEMHGLTTKTPVAELSKQWNHSLAFARKHALGNNLSFVLGDLNWDKDRRGPRGQLQAQLLNSYGFTSCFSEKEMPTHGKETLDHVLSYSRDKRVALHRVKLMEGHFNTDHRPFTAWYRIRQLAR